MRKQPETYPHFENGTSVAYEQTRRTVHAENLCPEDKRERKRRLPECTGGLEDTIREDEE